MVSPKSCFAPKAAGREGFSIFLQFGSDDVIQECSDDICLCQMTFDLRKDMRFISRRASAGIGKYQQTSAHRLQDNFLVCRACILPITPQQVL